MSDLLLLLLLLLLLSCAGQPLLLSWRSLGDAEVEAVDASITVITPTVVRVGIVVARSPASPYAARAIRSTRARARCARAANVPVKTPRAMTERRRTSTSTKHSAQI